MDLLARFFSLFIVKLTVYRPRHTRSFLTKETDEQNSMLKDDDEVAHNTLV